MKPICIVIAAMGGEGGGVLTDWLVEAAGKAGLAAQATSIPGVAQRTGATTYYVEIYPVPLAELGGARPVLALAPSAGEVDLAVATELMEAARTVWRGITDPARTRLISSTHRVYAVSEKTAMGDGRHDSDSLLRVVEAGSASRVLFDMERAAKAAGCVVNSVLLGAIAGAGGLPIAPEIFEECIRDSGKAVESNLRGFQAGLKAAQGDVPAPSAETGKRPHADIPAALALMARANSELPEKAAPAAVEGVKRLAAYQDLGYAQLYLERLAPIWAAERDGGGDGSATLAVAKRLAVRMSFDDVIRVAQLKTEPERFNRIRAEIGAAPGQPIVIRDYLKPGVEEICGLLPGFIARPVLALARSKGWTERLSWAAEINSGGVAGYAFLRLLAGLRPLRKIGHRWGEEQAAIEAWMEAVLAAVRLSPLLGLEVAECGKLVKGYGETWRRGQASLARITDQVVTPALQGRWPLGKAIDAVASARVAALADPEGDRLERTLAEIKAA